MFEKFGGCVRNEEVHRRAGIDWEFVTTVHQIVLRWFGHAEKMDEFCMARRMLIRRH